MSGAYEHALATGEALWAWRDGERAFRLDVDRWRAAADDTDLDVVRRARSPVLDVGCGPGRMIAAMTDHGHLALGIDVSRAAVAMTRARGLNVLRRSVFEPLPGEASWRTVIVLDGSIGIGGDLLALLARLGQLVAEDGQLVIETHPDADRRTAYSIRLGTASVPVGPLFAWTSVGAHALADAAEDAGLTAVSSRTTAGRTFVTLQRALAASRQATDAHDERYDRAAPS